MCRLGTDFVFLDRFRMPYLTKRYSTQNLLYFFENINNTVMIDEKYPLSKVLAYKGQDTCVSDQTADSVLERNVYYSKDALHPVINTIGELYSD